VQLTPIPVLGLLNCIGIHIQMNVEVQNFDQLCHVPNENAHRWHQKAKITKSYRKKELRISLLMSVIRPEIEM